MYYWQHNHSITLPLICSCSENVLCSVSAIETSTQDQTKTWISVHQSVLWLQYLATQLSGLCVQKNSDYLLSARSDHQCRSHLLIVIHAIYLCTIFVNRWNTYLRNKDNEVRNKVVVRQYEMKDGGGRRSWVMWFQEVKGWKGWFQSCSYVSIYVKHDIIILLQGSKTVWSEMIEWD